MHLCLLSHIYEQFLLKPTLSKSMILRVKNIFEPNVLKEVIKIIFISSSPFSLLIINVNILSNLKKEWCTFGRKKTTPLYVFSPFNPFTKKNSSKPMKWLQTISDVGALLATSIRSLFSLMYQNFTSIYLDFIFYMNPLCITINDGNMLILSFLLF